MRRKGRPARHAGERELAVNPELFSAVILKRDDAEVVQGR